MKAKAATKHKGKVVRVGGGYYRLEPVERLKVTRIEKTLAKAAKAAKAKRSTRAKG